MCRCSVCKAHRHFRVSLVLLAGAVGFCCWVAWR